MPWQNGYALQSGETLTLGQSLVSQDSRFELKFETTGRLILYFGSTVLWEASQEWWFSEVPQPTALVMQPDGDAVIYNPNWQPLWATGASGNFGAALVLQDDGNLVVYDASFNPIWDSGTCCH